MIRYKERLRYECHLPLRLNTNEWHWYCAGCGERQKYYPGELKEWHRREYARWAAFKASHSEEG